MQVAHFYKLKSSGIYGIVNLINGKIYIGSACNIYTRLRTHISCLNNNKHQNKHLQHAWNKYGANNFKAILCELCDVDELLSKEQHHLSKHNNVYNIMKDVQRRNHSDESKKRMSKTWKRLYKSIPAHHRTKINQYNIHGEFVKTWDSIKEACVQLGCSEAAMYRRLRGVITKPFNGFIFKRVNIDLIKSDELLEHPERKLGENN